MSRNRGATDVSLFESRPVKVFALLAGARELHARPVDHSNQPHGQRHYWTVRSGFIGRGSDTRLGCAL